MTKRLWIVKTFQSRHSKHISFYEKVETWFRFLNKNVLFIRYWKYKIDILEVRYWFTDIGGEIDILLVRSWFTSKKYPSPFEAQLTKKNKPNNETMKLKINRQWTIEDEGSGQLQSLGLHHAQRGCLLYKLWLLSFTCKLRTARKISKNHHSYLFWRMDASYLHIRGQL